MHIAHVPESCRADYEEARRIVAKFIVRLRGDPRARRLERLAGYRLALEWFALVAGTYFLVFGPLPLWLKALLLGPWAIYAGLSLDCIIHYANHWPMFRGRVANTLVRWSGALVLFNPREIEHVHNDHHRAYSRPDGEGRLFGPEDRERSFWRYLAEGLVDGLRLLWPWRAMEPCVAGLRSSKPAVYREIMAMRVAFPLVVATLTALDPWDTLLLFVPTVVVVGSFASLVMNLTDHVPGDPRHPFRLATFLEPATPAERVFSAINHHTAATHLTHHLFPQVHWVHLRAVQRELAPIYARQGAPRSLLINSALIGNPLRFAWVLRELERRRFEL